MNLYNLEPIDQVLMLKQEAYKLCMKTDMIIKPIEE
jgi:hypothetical protein